MYQMRCTQRRRYAGYQPAQGLHPQYRRALEVRGTNMFGWNMLSRRVMC